MSDCTLVLCDFPYLPPQRQKFSTRYWHTESENTSKRWHTTATLDSHQSHRDTSTYANQIRLSMKESTVTA